jgi:hypothetical protein
MYFVLLAFIFRIFYFQGIIRIVNQGNALIFFVGRKNHRGYKGRARLIQSSRNQKIRQRICSLDELKKEYVRKETSKYRESKTQH